MDLFNSFLCPISKSILKDPYVAEDGFIYEKERIERWLLKFKDNPLQIISPSTGKPMGNKILPCFPVKVMIENLLEKHPEYREEQYVPDPTPEIKKFLETGQYEKLLNYKIFSSYCFDFHKTEDEVTVYMPTQPQRNAFRFPPTAHVALPPLDIDVKSIKPKYKMKHNLMRDFFQKAPLHVQKYVVDHFENLEEEMFRGLRPIHAVCKWSSDEMIKYVVDKGVNLESNFGGKTPIFLVCKYASDETIFYLLDKNVNLYLNNRKRCDVSGYLLRNRKVENLYLIQKKILEKVLALLNEKIEKGEKKPKPFIIEGLGISEQDFDRMVSEHRRNNEAEDDFDLTTDTQIYRRHSTNDFIPTSDTEIQRRRNHLLNDLVPDEIRRQFGDVVDEIVPSNNIQSENALVEEILNFSTFQEFLASPNPAIQEAISTLREGISNTLWEQLQNCSISQWQSMKNMIVDQFYHNQ